MDISKFLIWRKNVYLLLSSKGIEVPSEGKWQKICYKFYMEYYNVDFTSENSNSDLKEIYDFFILNVSIKFKIEIDEVEKIFEIASKSIDGDTNFSIEILKKKVPMKIKDRLLKFAGNLEFELLLNRYFVIGFTEGLFLSIDPDIYKYCIKSSKLPTIEAYASPFNNNHVNYCSLFFEDRVYGSLIRFDHYIDKLNIPARLCINPPYVNKVMEKCLTKTLTYMSKYRGEFIALLPVMNEFPIMEKFLSSKNTAWTTLAPEEYTLYNFLQDSTILANMHLYLACNVENSLSASKDLLNQLARLIKEKAMFLK